MAPIVESIEIGLSPAQADRRLDFCHTATDRVLFIVDALEHHRDSVTLCEHRFVRHAKKRTPPLTG
jgi:hypothetical protein